MSITQINSKDSTHYHHKCDAANSRHRTFNYGGKRKYFEHNTTNHGCITYQYDHSNLNYKPKTANSESHRTNSRQYTTDFDYNSYE